VAKVHSKISRVRSDFLHKRSRKTVNENQVIVVENLAVKNMVKNHNLAQAISDAGWGMFCTMLKYKAEFDGKTYLEIGSFFPLLTFAQIRCYKSQRWISVSARLIALVAISDMTEM
jgi:putative transposase